MAEKQIRIWVGECGLITSAEMDNEHEQYNLGDKEPCVLCFNSKCQAEVKYWTNETLISLENYLKAAGIAK